jgi:hypothetical protein
MAETTITPSQRLFHLRWLQSRRNLRFPESFAKPLPKARPLPPLLAIRRIVCAEFNTSEKWFTSPSRAHELCLARHVFSYFARKFTKASLHQIASALGGQDHSMVIYGIRQTRAKIRDGHLAAPVIARLEGVLAKSYAPNLEPPDRSCVGRYVKHENVGDYLALGWMWAANLNEYAALLIWPCKCRCVEPRRNEDG